jgi:ribonuclease HI
MPELRQVNGFNLENGNTNNTGELRAILISLQKIYKDLDKNKQRFKEIEIISDSEYAINAITETNKSIKNLDLISKIIKLRIELSKYFTITFRHVDAHTKNKDYYSLGNDIVDNIARTCAINQKNYGNGENRIKIEKIEKKINEFYHLYKNE